MGKYDERIERLYNLGYTNRQIERTLGVSEYMVRTWLETHGKKSNYGHHKEMTPCPKNCKYAGTADGDPCCDYIFMEGKPRGCEGGANCKKYEYCAEASRHHNFLISDKSWQQLAIVLYNKGYTDSQIAYTAGVTNKAVEYWRNSHGLAKNGDEPSYTEDFNHRQALLIKYMAENHLSCQKMAERVGCSREKVRRCKVGQQRVTSEILAYINQVNGGEKNESKN